MLFSATTHGHGSRKITPATQVQPGPKPREGETLLHSRGVQALILGSGLRTRLVCAIYSAISVGVQASPITSVAFYNQRSVSGCNHLEVRQQRQAFAR